MNLGRTLSGKEGRKVFTPGGGGGGGQYSIDGSGSRELIARTYYIRKHTIIFHTVFINYCMYRVHVAM